jgi:hypothetical protein
VGYRWTWSHLATHTHTHTHTLGRSTLDQRSARHRDLSPTTHNNYKRQTPLPPVEFEPATPVRGVAALHFGPRGNRCRPMSDLCHRKGNIFSSLTSLSGGLSTWLRQRSFPFSHEKCFSDKIHLHNNTHLLPASVSVVVVWWTVCCM